MHKYQTMLNLRFMSFVDTDHVSVCITFWSANSQARIYIIKLLWISTSSLRLVKVRFIFFIICIFGCKRSKTPLQKFKIYSKTYKIVPIYKHTQLWISAHLLTTYVKTPTNTCTPIVHSLLPLYRWSSCLTQTHTIAPDAHTQTHSHTLMRKPPSSFATSHSTPTRPRARIQRL